MLFLCFVIFVVYTTGHFMFYSLPSLSSCFFIFSIVIISLGEEGAGLCASRAFVCLFFTYVSFCPFSPPLGIEGWLRFVIVAFHGLFY